MKKSRQSNYELMRIISMMMVVMWHLIFHGGLFQNSQGVTKFILEFLVLFGAVNVNSFILLFGYFNYNKDFSLQRILSLIKTVWFYKIIFLLIALIIGDIAITKLEIFKELLPIDMRDYWFINCYLVLYIISPFINILISKMTQQQHRKLLIVSFLFFSIVPFITNNTTVSNDGYTVINFIFMYLIGSYLKKYPIENNKHFEYYSKNKIQLICLILFFSFLIFNFMIYQFSKILINMNNSLIYDIGNNFNINYRSFSNPMVILQTVFYFLFFSTLKIKSKFINLIGKKALDVYLIHENYYMLFTIYRLMMTDKWFVLGNYFVILLTFVEPIVVFFICILIGYVKDFIFNILSKFILIKKIKLSFYKYIDEF